MEGGKTVKKVLNSLAAAFAMYSKLPAPQVVWSADTLSYALCFFPLVGLVVGAFLGLWLWLSTVLGLGIFLRGAGALLVPILLTGGMHLDGFCDTADALGSHQTRERMLEILKDSRIGAFALFACVGYLIFYFALWCEVECTWGAVLTLALVPGFSRGLSGYAAVTFPNARGTGLLATFSDAAKGVRARGILLIWCCVLGGCMGWLAPLYGISAVAAACLTFAYFYVMSRRRFGGITGDLAGYFLQLCEAACLLAVVLAQKLSILIGGGI